MVSYDDGAMRDFSLDPRALFSVAAGSEGCISIDRSVPRIVVEAGAACAEVGLTVELPALAAGLNASAAVPVVHLASLALSLTPHPSYPGSSARSTGSLGFVACTSHFQRARGVVRASLSDGTSSAALPTACSNRRPDSILTGAPTPY